jgi:protein-disulfide isomerase
MHAALFEHQDALQDDQLVQYAADLDLDTGRIRRELGAHSHAAKVREDFESGLRSDARGTPTFYLLDVRYDGVVGVRQFLAAIQKAHPEVVSAKLEGDIGRRIIPRVVKQRSPFRPSAG